MPSRDWIISHNDVIKTRQTALRRGRFWTYHSEGGQLSVYVPPEGSFTSKVSQGDKYFPRLGKKGGVCYAGATFWTHAKVTKGLAVNIVGEIRVNPLSDNYGIS